MKIHKREEGLAHLAMILLVVVVVGAIGGVGYYVMSKNKKSSTTTSNATAKAIQQAAAAECKNVDKDLCKFFTSWKAQSSYTVVSTSTSPEDTTPMKSTYIISGGNSHITTSGQTAYEVISIGDTTTYTKASDGTWWKQTIKKEDASNYKPQTDTTFSEDQKDDAGQAITYTKIGMEACGNLTCFKYQEVDPSSKDKNYIWFDNKDYQLRRERNESTDGSVNDSSFSYAKVDVKAPSPSKDLGPDQYIVPGESQPRTAPNAAAVQSQIDVELNGNATIDN